MFRVGQKVVCVDAKPRHECDVPLGTYLTEGEIYTVAKMVPGFERHEGVHLVGIPLEYRAYYADRFRPAVERKTDISVFKALLKTTKISEDV